MNEQSRNEVKAMATARQFLIDHPEIALDTRDYHSVVEIAKKMARHLGVAYPPEASIPINPENNITEDSGQASNLAGQTSDGHSTL